MHKNRNNRNSYENKSDEMNKKYTFKKKIKKFFRCL